MKIIRNICYTEPQNELQNLHLYLPDSENFSVLVYFHGGGLENGDHTEAEHFTEYLTANNIAVASVNYRKYPFARYPDFICDCAAAVSWVFKNISSYGNCSKIYAGGSSAGGYISMMLCFDKKYLTPFGLTPDDISGFIHNAGQPTTHFNVLRERGLDSRRCIIDDAAPLYHVGTSPSYPPMLLIVADNDMPVRLEQMTTMKKTLEHFGYDNSKYDLKIVENSNHCQYNFENDTDGINKFGKMICEFIGACEK